VERLLKVKDLLRNQGFTIAGARKVLREGVSREGVSAKSEVSPAAAAQPVSGVTPLRPVSSAATSSPAAAPVALAPMRAPAPMATPTQTVPPAVVWAASEETQAPSDEQPVQTIALSGPAVLGEPAAVSGIAAASPVSDVAAERAPMFELVLPSAASSDRSAKRLRRALVDLRQDVLSAIKQLG
jgi:hypothetical protein